MLTRTKSFVLILGALLMFGMAGTASAEDWCTRHIEHQRHELNEAIRHHGYHSRQAEHERRELHRVLDQCNARGYR